MPEVQVVILALPMIFQTEVLGSFGVRTRGNARMLR